MQHANDGRRLFFEDDWRSPWQDAIGQQRMFDAFKWAPQCQRLHGGTAQHIPHHHRRHKVIGQQHTNATFSATCELPTK